MGAASGKWVSITLPLSPDPSNGWGLKKETAEAIPPVFPSSSLMVPSLEALPVVSLVHPVLDPTSALEISQPTVS